MSMHQVFMDVGEVVKPLAFHFSRSWVLFSTGKDTRKDMRMWPQQILTFIYVSYATYIAAFNSLQVTPLCPIFSLTSSSMKKCKRHKHSMHKHNNRS